jgi:hypothetical protein
MQVIKKNSLIKLTTIVKVRKVFFLLPKAFITLALWQIACASDSGIPYLYFILGESQVKQSSLSKDA